MALGISYSCLPREASLREIAHTTREYDNLNYILRRAHTGAFARALSEIVSRAMKNLADEKLSIRRGANQTA